MLKLIFPSPGRKYSQDDEIRSKTVTTDSNDEGIFFPQRRQILIRYLGENVILMAKVNQGNLGI